MTVKAILKQKGDRVVAVRPDDTVGSVCSILDKEGIGAVLVRDADQRVIGVVSERDVVRSIARLGRDMLDHTVSSIMTRDVHFCSPEDSVDQVMAQMTDRRIRHLPVLKRGKLVGMISIGDVVKQRIADHEMEAEAMKAYIATG